MPNNTAKAPHLLTGAAGEDKAAAFLQGLGFKILCRNWRPAANFGTHASSLELDIIAAHKDELIFIEVKSRLYKAESAFSPLDSFTKSKQNRILKAAKFYLEEYQAWNHSCRFDLICIIFKPDKSYSLEHYKNVLSFDAASRGAAHSGHTPWQPW